jgi:hypothetical protein
MRKPAVSVSCPPSWIEPSIPTLVDRPPTDLIGVTRLSGTGIASQLSSTMAKRPSALAEAMTGHTASRRSLRPPLRCPARMPSSTARPSCSTIKATPASLPSKPDLTARPARGSSSSLSTSSFSMARIFDRYRLQNDPFRKACQSANDGINTS